MDGDFVIVGIKATISADGSSEEIEITKIPEDTKEYCDAFKKLISKALNESNAKRMKIS